MAKAMQTRILLALIAAILGTFIAVAAMAQSFVGSPYIRVPTGAEAYQKATPSSGFALTFAPNQSQMVILGASTLASGTINLNPTPYDGQENCFYTKPIVTSLTLAALSPQTLHDAVTATAATTSYCYIFSASNNTWDRNR